MDKIETIALYVKRDWSYSKAKKAYGKGFMRKTDYLALRREYFNRSSPNAKEQKRSKLFKEVLKKLRKRVFRSSVVTSYNSKNKTIEIRLWKHSDTPETTQFELDKAFNSLILSIAPKVAGVHAMIDNETADELNEEIEDIDYSFCKGEGHTYFYEQMGNLFAESDRIVNTKDRWYGFISFSYEKK